MEIFHFKPLSLGQRKGEELFILGTSEHVCQEGPEMPVLKNGQVQRFGSICKNVVRAVCKNGDPS